MRKRSSSKNKIFTTVLVFVIIAVLCSCGNTEAMAGSTETAETEYDKETAQAETAEQPENDDAAQTVDVVQPEEHEEDAAVTEVADLSSGQAGASVPSASAVPGPAAVEFKGNIYNADEAEGTEGVYFDFSNSQDGYFGVHSDSDARIKIQVKKDDETYIYDPVNGEDQFFPFQLGDGKYKISAMKNIEGNKYFELYSTSVDVTLADEFEPFLRPSQYANYAEDSLCVVKAAGFNSQSSDELDFISKVYDFVCSTVTYDDEKALTVVSGYKPVPDETMTTGKGICFDYASLTASMLRSQGIPTKIIFGYVGKDELYHAWNMFYTEKDGWVTVEFKINPNEWNRVDLTFYANGADATFIGDGTNYIDIYEY